MKRHNHNMNENDSYITESQVNHLCLCSGYDGVGRGLRQLFPNLRTIAYVEREGFPIANLVKKAEENKMDAAPVFTDVKAFPYRKFRGCVDILSAGFPCQPFSSAGKRQATEDPRHLYPWIADGITACRPTVVLLENVEGIISAKTGDGESVLKYVLRDLESRGYSCAWGVFSAEEVGAPHQRKRVFIVAHAKDGQSRQSETRHGREGAVGRSEEVGDTKHDGLLTAEDGGSVSSKQEEGRMQELEGRCEQSQNELADCEYERHGRRDTSGSCGVDSEGRANPQEEQTSHDLRSETKGCCGESRKVGDTSSVGSCRRSENESRQQSEMFGTGSESTQYPARPGEEQYEWEPPRTTESRLGRGVDGSTDRIDRLRLLGNGVVPDTCALAFRT